MPRLGRAQSFKPILRQVILTGIANDPFGTSNSGDLSSVSSFSGPAKWFGTNRMLAIDVPFMNAAGSVSAMTYGGAACTFIGAQNVAGGTGRIENWRICQKDPSAPPEGSNTLLVTYSGVIVDTSVQWVNYVNVDQEQPTEAWAGNSGINVGVATDATVVVTPVTDQTWCHFASATSQGSGVTAGSGTTKRNVVTGAGGTGIDSDTAGPVAAQSNNTGIFTGQGITSAWTIAGYAIRPRGVGAARDNPPGYVPPFTPQHQTVMAM